MRSHMVEPPIGEQPEQPPNGRQQRGYGPPPVRRGNGFVITGIILAVVVSTLSLIFSIIGLGKIKTLADAGKAMSIGRIAVPPPVSAAPVPSIAAGAGPAAVDPGCVTAASAGRQLTNTLNTDRAAISQDQNNPWAERADLQHLVTDLQSLQSQMTTAQAQAKHHAVKAGISAMIGDLNTFSSGLQALANGDLSQVNQVTSAGNNVTSDSHALQTTCTSVSAPGHPG